MSSLPLLGAGVAGGGAFVVPQAANPGFETDAANWNVADAFFLNNGGALVRTTGDFHSGVACGQITGDGALAFEGVAALPQAGYSFASGIQYTVSCWIKSVSGSVAMDLDFGSQTDKATGGITITTAWVQYSRVWTPGVTQTAGVFCPVLRCTAAAAFVCRVDDVVVTSP